MTTNDKTRDALMGLMAAITLDRNSEFNSEHPAIERAMKASVAALASTPAQPPAAAVPESEGLDPLPEYAQAFRPRWPGDEGGFTGAQMRLYALDAVAAWRMLAAAPTPAPAAQGEAVDLIDIARKTGLRDAMHGISPTDARGLLRTFLDEAAKVGITHLNPAAPVRAEVRPPVHADTERLDFIVSKLERDEYGWWLPDWCIKDGEHKPSSCEVRDSIDTRRGITPPSAADSGQGQQQGEA